MIFYYEKKNWTVARIFQQRCQEHPLKDCLLIDDRRLTFQQMEEYSNKVGAYFKEKGLTKGDCVALLMATRPEYVGIWLGLSKVGIITALVNSNLRKETLLHSINVAKAKAIIVGTELMKAFEDIKDKTEIKGLPVYQFSDKDQRLNANLELIEGKLRLFYSYLKALGFYFLIPRSCGLNRSFGKSTTTRLVCKHKRVQATR